MCSAVDDSPSPSVDRVPAHLVPAHLVHELLTGNCVAFLGAGFSGAQRLPGWKALLSEALNGVPVDNEASAAAKDHVSALLNKQNTSHRDFWEAAQVLESLLGRNEFIAALARCLHFDQLTPGMRARLLLLNSLPLRAVLTTNFDSVLDGVCASTDDDNVPSESIVRGSGDAIQRGTLKRVLEIGIGSKYFCDPSRTPPTLLSFTVQHHTFKNEFNHIASSAELAFRDCDSNSHGDFIHNKN